VPIVAQTIAYRDGATELTGCLFFDDARSERRPGILVVHGGAGLDDHAKGRARRFAELGYVVFACDMYGNGVAEGGRPRIMSLILQLSADPAKLCQRAQAGIEVLRAHPHVDGRLAAVGYCFGGMTVLELARNGVDLAAVVSVHGSVEPARRVAETHGSEELRVQPAPSPEDKRPMLAKVLVCHGALDPYVPMAHVTAFIDEMIAASADWQLLICGGALHGFTHETPSTTPGVAYNAQADARSSAAIQAFFAELFGPV